MRAFLLFPLLVLAVPDRPDPTPKEPKPAPVGIQGRWQAVKAVVLGQPQNPKPGDEDNVVLITATEFLSFKNGKQIEQKMTYTMDMTKAPATIDLVSKQGNMDIKLTGIFKIEGDTMTMCLSFLGGARPTQFMSTQENMSILLEVKRLPR